MAKDPRATLRAALASYIRATYDCTPKEFTEGYTKGARIVRRTMYDTPKIIHDPAYPAEGLELVALYDRLADEATP